MVRELSIAVGAGVVLAGQAVRMLLQATGVVVLSRLLPPDAFGVVAMAAVFLALSELLRDFGLTTAGLQSKELSEQQASNLFWGSTALGLLVGAILAATSPLIAAAYSEPRVAGVVLAFAVCTVLNGIQAQLQVHLARSMRYIALAATDVGSQALGLAVGIIGAVAGWGYWALVAQLVVAAAAMTTSRWIACAWRPLRPRDVQGTKQLLSAGADFGLASGLTFLANNTPAFAIGAVWGSLPTGFYNRAYQLLAGPLSQLFSPLINVIVPVARRAEHTGGADARDRVLLRAQLGVGGIGVCLFALVGANPDVAVRLLLGSGWETAVPYLQAFCVGGAVWTLSNVSFWGFIVTDRSRSLLKYNVITKGFTVVAVVAAVPFSPLAAAWAYSLCLAVSWPINLAWLKASSNYHAGWFLRDGLYLLVAGAAAFILAMVLVPAMGTPPRIPTVLTASVLGGMAYVAMIMVHPRMRRDASAVLRGLLTVLSANRVG